VAYLLCSLFWYRRFSREKMRIARSAERVPIKRKEVADQQKVTQTRKQSEHLDKSSFANRLIQSGIDRLMNRALFQVLR